MKKLLPTLLIVLSAATMPAIAQSGSTLPGQSGSTYVANASEGYYVKDGEAHYAWISTEGGEMQALRMLIPYQSGYPETVLYPEDVSEYGFLENRMRFVSATVETPEGERRLFLQEVQRVDDDTSILFLQKGVVPEDTWYSMEGGLVAEITTSDEPEPMWDYLLALSAASPNAGDNRSDIADVKLSQITVSNLLKNSIALPRRLRPSMIGRYYNGLVNGNEKMFPKNLFGVTVSAGAGSPIMNDTRTGGSTGRHVYNYGLSFSVGVFARFPFEEVLSFQPEVRYSRQVNNGSNIVGIGPDPYGRGTEFKNNSIRVPLMFRFTNTYSRKNIMPYAELGPVMDINFGDYVAWNAPEEHYINPSVETFTPGVAVGIGAEYYINSRQAAYLGLRMNYMFNTSRSHSYALRTFELVAGFSLFNY
ncbi:MAG: PorT family protein [Alistipes sp.]|jgi:hypothetical protein|nr:PorT family protein [Alistipes sp.]